MEKNTRIILQIHTLLAIAGFLLKHLHHRSGVFGLGLDLLGGILFGLLGGGFVVVGGGGGVFALGGFSGGWGGSGGGGGFEGAFDALEFLAMVGGGGGLVGGGEGE